MKRLLTSTLFIFIGLMFVHAQDNQTDPQSAIKAEFEAAAKAYKTGKFAEAQQHAERALALDPTNKQATIFVARTIHAQYRPGSSSSDTPENRAKAYEAIAAYQRVISNEPTNEEAYLAVTALYGAVKEESLQRQWIYQWASNTTLDEKKRANAYTTLAGKDWHCSHEITEQNKFTKGTGLIWRKPKDQNVYEKLKQCIANGLNDIEQAILLNPENELAWTHKANLLREQAKQAEMEDNKVQRDEYLNQASAAMTKALELAGSNTKQNQGSAISSSPETSSTSRIINSGVLNGKAVSFPAPKYPVEARAAKASGTVVVHVVVDEEGKVTEAKAISGHPLLRDAAIEAAKKARFSKTIISGQPMKISGTLNYNFVSY
jgi:TonB family protein